MPTVNETDLHAFLDGALPESRCREVEAYLSLHPDEQQRIDAYRKLEARLHQQFDYLLDEPLPEQLRPKPVSTKRAAWLSRVAASIALISLGSVIGWQSNELLRTQPAWEQLVLVQPAATAHRVYAAEVRHPVEVPAEQEAHLTAWLSKRFDAEVRIPDLNPAGFALVGGRLLPGSDGIAAQFMYENPQGRRLTLYLRRTNDLKGPSAFRYQTTEGIGTFYWIDGDFGYALSGDLDRQQLLQAAHLSYRSLNPE